MQFSFVGAKIIKSIERWWTFWEKLNIKKRKTIAWYEYYSYFCTKIHNKKTQS